MVILKQEYSNEAFITCSRNKNLPSPTFLFTIRHKLADQKWKFIPYRIPSTAVGYEPSYDAFAIDIFSGSAENYIGTSGNTCNLYLIPGEYYLKIYEQYSSTNLNPALSYDVVYEGMIIVEEADKPEDIAYTGTSNTYIIYGN